MKENIFDFKSKDGISLQGVHWHCAKSPKAVIVIVHGHGEHKMRYKHVGEYFTGHGYEVYAMDHRGHGKSEGKRGHSPSYEHLLDDVEQFIGHIRSKFIDSPLILYGHSMGGNIVLNYLLKRNATELSASIVSAPMLRLAFDPPKWKEKLGSMMAGIWPSLTQPTGLDATLLSRDTRQVAKYVNDPLVHDKMSAGLYTGLMTNAQVAIDAATQLKTPTLLIHGTDDQIISYKGSEEFANNAGEIVTLHLLKGYYHEPHNDNGHEKVLKIMSDWTDNCYLN